VIRELEARGHSAVAPDLPTDDPGAGAREYAGIVVDALGDCDDVVAVGHSLGGMTVPIVAAMRPVRRMVFLGAMVPAPGEVYGEFLATQPDALTAAPPPTAYDGSGVRPPRTWEVALDAYYLDVPSDVARRAWQRLRPQSATLFTERCPLEAWPDVPSTYILMTDDRSVSPDWSRRVARARLGVDPIELPGGHSPFLSRPGQLADVLASLAKAPYAVTA
jgi:pimeloyl-ACP methyl ester carboxylesterase